MRVESGGSVEVDVFARYSEARFEAKGGAPSGFRCDEVAALDGVLKGFAPVEVSDELEERLRRGSETPPAADRRKTAHVGWQESLSRGSEMRLAEDCRLAEGVVDQVGFEVNGGSLEAMPVQQIEMRFEVHGCCGDITTEVGFAKGVAQAEAWEDLEKSSSWGSETRLVAERRKAEDVRLQESLSPGSEMRFVAVAEVVADQRGFEAKGGSLEERPFQRTDIRFEARGCCGEIAVEVGFAKCVAQPPPSSETRFVAERSKAVNILEDDAEANLSRGSETRFAADCWKAAHVVDRVGSEAKGAIFQDLPMQQAGVAVEVGFANGFGSAASRSGSGTSCPPGGDRRGWGRRSCVRGVGGGAGPLPDLDA